MTWERSVCCLRVWIVIVTAILWLFGGGIFGFCLWILLDFFINQYVKAADEIKTVLVIVHVIIVVGVSLLVFGIIGIYGAARPRRWALIMYLICLVCVTGVLLGGAIYCYVYRVEIKSSIKTSRLLGNVIRNDYGSNTGVTTAFDYMQIELQCCGGEDYSDYQDSNWLTKINTDQNDPNIVDKQGKNKVPLSCCKNAYIHQTFQWCPVYLDDTSGASLPDQINPQMYTKSCRVAIVEFLENKVLNVLGLGLSIAVLVILLLAILLTSALIHKLRKPPPSTNHDDDVVYEMARSQEKSPYPTRGPYANLYNS